MNILALDTAGKTAAVAVMQDDILRYETMSNTGLTHSETLLPMVDTALHACNLTTDQIDLYAVTNGPGSFTGLRIGLAAVKGLAFANNTPCAGVSTLAALAWGVAGAGTVIGALDARRGQVYWAGFDLESHERLTQDAAEPVQNMENFVNSCKKPLIFVGDGAALCYNKYGSVPGVLACPQPLRVLRGAGTALAGKALWESGGCVSPAALLPDYHRLSQAERERAEREAAKNVESTPAL
ncbi:MAG: tRNA (adenosine(37)-N6)-threonylcarbamoyltransferase complex dimerization subunit type 1 TsaB [Oscillospiraceae bacterium]|nr:tRNA (adenosine(37)-N6)-threonylcarbamoyltransferase complex dimerization subunit type 1 TsaB [Oscillospiraceae bacterium]